MADECRWDHKTPAQFREASRAELKDRYPGQCTFVDGEVRTINALEPPKGQTGTQFEAVLTSGEVFKAQKVILASGCRDILPFIDGFEECWGTGVVHCLLCHGHEERGAESVGILALDAFAEPSTLLRVLRTCKQFAARVHIYTHGNGRAAASLKEVTGLVPGATVESKEIDVLERVDPAGERPSDIRVVLENGQLYEEARIARQKGRLLARAGKYGDALREYDAAVDMVRRGSIASNGTGTEPAIAELELERASIYARSGASRSSTSLTWR